MERTDILSVVSILIAISIGMLQIYSSRKQDKRFEKRHEDLINTEAIRFLHSYSSSELYLLPLCLIASRYSRSFCYRRKLYNDFCCLTPEVQNRVLCIREIDIHIDYGMDVFSFALKSALDVYETTFVHDTKEIVQDIRVYLYKALFDYNTEKIPNIAHSSADLDSSRDRFIREWSIHVLANEYDGCNPVRIAIEELNNRYSTSELSSVYKILYSYLCCVFIKYMTRVGLTNSSRKSVLDCVDNYAGDLYMEDIFLRAILEPICRSDLGLL